MEEKTANSSSQNKEKRIVLCPICEKEAVKEYFPFCSKRCADIDLNRWFSGVYAFSCEKNEQDEEGLPSEENTEEL